MPAVPNERTIAAGESKAKSLKLMDEVQDSGASIVIRRGKPVARLVPANGTTAGARPSSFGHMRGTVKILGNILEPIEEEWEFDEVNILGREA